MSGEDQRHSYHADEINDLVDSRVTLEDGRIGTPLLEGEEAAKTAHADFCASLSARVA